MSIEKGRWVDGRYVDGNGNEMKPPVSERPKGYKPSTGMVNGVEKKKKRYKKLKDIFKKLKIHYPKPEDLDQESFKELVYDLFILLREKVFTIPVLTMIGVWIIVLYIIFS